MIFPNDLEKLVTMTHRVCGGKLHFTSCPTCGLDEVPDTDCEYVFSDILAELDDGTKKVTCQVTKI